MDTAEPLQQQQHNQQHHHQQVHWAQRLEAAVELHTPPAAGVPSPRPILRPGQEAQQPPPEDVLQPIQQPAKQAARPRPSPAAPAPITGMKRSRRVSLA